MLSCGFDSCFLFWSKKKKEVGSASTVFQKASANGMSLSCDTSKQIRGEKRCNSKSICYWYAKMVKKKVTTLKVKVKVIKMNSTTDVFQRLHLLG